jgi:hypothetical protein
MRIARVFPRRTNATPTDSLAFVGLPDMFVEADEVHISVAWTWDLPVAERLAKEWEHVAPVKIGGPATGMRGEGFEPGKYIAPGYVITSRGCPNRCWFCSVWKREGQEVRELPIRDGYNILDDNLLACSEDHVRAVFAMLARQKERAQFTGGLEAARLKDWHIDLLTSARVAQMFFAWDTDDDLEPLCVAAKKLHEAGFNRHKLRVYVLIGYPGDTMEKAEERLRHCVTVLGMWPMAMLYRDKTGARKREWMRFQKQWARPVLIARNTA